MSEFFKFDPAVFAVDKSYQIMMPCEKAGLFFVKVRDKFYYDESNGIMRSRNEIHRVEVPMDELDEAGEYTVCIRPVIERKPYFTETEEVLEKRYKFCPIPEKGIRAYHISDAHNLIKEPVRAAETFGDIDFLILNGDVIEHSGDPSKFINIYEICSLLMKGEKPCIFSRGNHDLRGDFAEKFADYTPSYLGNTYYSFRLGNIWGILLDCGEDKPDDHEEYGFTVACHAFRERQTEFLKKIIKNKENEYEIKGKKVNILDSNGNIVEELETTDTDTYSKYLNLGTYYIKEISTLYGYKLDETNHEVKLEYDNETNEFTTLGEIFMFSEGKFYDKNGNGPWLNSDIEEIQ
mgnify:CR=1 FL=1